MKTSQPETDNVIREEIKEHRGDYFVVYKPADANLPFATVSIVFPNDALEIRVMEVMERELDFWLKRFAVPIMVSAFNAADSVIHISHYDQSHLMGYIDSETGKIVKKWGLFRDKELPSNQACPTYLRQVYKDMPFRLQQEVRQKAEREARSMGQFLKAITVFVVAIPLLIEIIKATVDWVDHIFAALSILKGLYEAGKAMGWLKSSKRKKDEDEKQRKMEHYFYHCEKNPDAFLRLKIENFKQETIKQTQKDAEEIQRLSKTAN